MRRGHDGALHPRSNSSFCQLSPRSCTRDESGTAIEESMISQALSPLLQHCWCAGSFTIPCCHLPCPWRPAPPPQTNARACRKSIAASRPPPCPPPHKLKAPNQKAVGAPNREPQLLKAVASATLPSRAFRNFGLAFVVKRIVRENAGCIYAFCDAPAR